MKTTIKNIILDEQENTLLCEIIYTHENGDIFRDYTTLSALDITEQLSYDEIVLMLEHLDSEDLAKTIAALYTYTVYEMLGNFSFVAFGSEEEYEAIEYIQERVNLDMIEANAYDLEDEEYEATEENFYSYYAITNNEEK